MDKIFMFNPILKQMMIINLNQPIILPVKDLKSQVINLVDKIR